MIIRKIEYFFVYYSMKIYKLIDPKTKEIRYIGKTEDDLLNRLIGHLSSLKRKRLFNDKNEWIISLLKENLVPIIELIEDCKEDKEKYWINYYKINNNLLNIVFNNNEELLKFRSSIKSKKIYQYDLEGNFIKEWNSATEAAKNLEIENTNICNSAKFSRKLCGNYQWRYDKKDKISSYKIDKFTKSVYEYDFEGNYIKEYKSAREINEISFKLISKCCNGYLHTVYGKRYSFNKVDKLSPIIYKKRGRTKIKDIV